MVAVTVGNINREACEDFIDSSLRFQEQALTTHLVSEER
jgi:hypothetical protein